MFLKKIKIKNFRLLKDIELNIDKNTTLIVGRNNTGKTSCMQFIKKVLRNSPLSYDDYPLSIRNHVFGRLLCLYNNKITFEQFKKMIPTVSIRFFIDYSDVQDDENLGALSPFIIDVNYDTTEAIVHAEYSLNSDEHYIINFLANYINDSDHKSIKDETLFRNALYEIFPKIFKLTITAIDPENKDNYQIKRQEEFQELFPLYVISAERHLDEEGNKTNNSLNKLISNFFNKTLDEETEQLTREIEKLRNTVLQANIEIQKQTTGLLSNLIETVVGFGYPNAEELQLGVQTKLDINDQLQTNSELTYSDLSNNHTLPSSYNGLGYKNLIKIQFELASFSELIKDAGFASIPLLFIEEPESHMHPQMQQTFIKYVEDFLSTISNNVKIQTIITSHSAHIANTVDFSKIRYAQKSMQGVVYKDLKVFSCQDTENLDFIKKYLTLTKCDLFFADKAIFVEGAAERLLFPDIIDRSSFSAVELKDLKSQYYTIIEVGGAYAYKFKPLMMFLGIPCLIVTDIDSVDANNKTVLVSEGIKSSNTTINNWIKEIKNDKEYKASLGDIKNLDAEKKTQNNIHLEFQTEENSLCGRSLEEAIKNVNRETYRLPDDCKESDLIFNEKCKTDFILGLISSGNDYNIPEYIKSGLKWLEQQKVLK